MFAVFFKIEFNSEVSRVLNYGIIPNVIGVIKMARLFFISGIGLIVMSGTLFTLERFLAVFYYASDSFPVKLNGTGTY